MTAGPSRNESDKSKHKNIGERNEKEWGKEEKMR